MIVGEAGFIKRYYDVLARAAELERTIESQAARIAALEDKLERLWDHVLYGDPT